VLVGLTLGVAVIAVIGITVVFENRPIRLDQAEYSPFPASLDVVYRTEGGVPGAGPEIRTTYVVLRLLLPLALSGGQIGASTAMGHW
jgi:hypothetical protein